MATTADFYDGRGSLQGNADPDTWPDRVHTDWVYTFDAGAVHVRPPTTGIHPRSAPRPTVSWRR